MTTVHPPATADGLVEASQTDDFIQDPELRLFGERMRDSHDLWHVVTGYGRDTFGEACLLAFTYAQTQNRGLGIITLVGMIKIARQLGPEVKKAVWQAYRAGKLASARRIDKPTCDRAGARRCAGRKWLSTTLVDHRSCHRRRGEIDSAEDEQRRQKPSPIFGALEPAVLQRNRCGFELETGNRQDFGNRLVGGDRCCCGHTGAGGIFGVGGWDVAGVVERSAGVRASEIHAVSTEF